MKSTIRFEGVEADAFLEEFAARTVAFALWHYDAPVRSVRIELVRSAQGTVECALRARMEGLGVLRARGLGASAHDAIVAASDRLELALLARLRAAGGVALAA
jgi:hypothetical protein